MAEGEAEHSRKKELYKQELLQQSQINETEAQEIINQVKTSNTARSTATCWKCY